MYFWRRVVNAFHSSQCWGLVDASSFYNLGVDRFSSYFITVYETIWPGLICSLVFFYLINRIDRRTNTHTHTHTHIPFVADKWYPLIYFIFLFILLLKRETTSEKRKSLLRWRIITGGKIRRFQNALDGNLNYRMYIFFKGNFKKIWTIVYIYKEWLEGKGEKEKKHQYIYRLPQVQNSYRLYTNAQQQIYSIRPERWLFFEIYINI